MTPQMWQNFANANALLEAAIAKRAAAVDVEQLQLAERDQADPELEAAGNPGPEPFVDDDHFLSQDPAVRLCLAHALEVVKAVLPPKQMKEMENSLTREAHGVCNFVVWTVMRTLTDRINAVSQVNLAQTVLDNADHRDAVAHILGRFLFEAAISKTSEAVQRTWEAKRHTKVNNFLARVGPSLPSFLRDNMNTRHFLFMAGLHDPPAHSDFDAWRAAMVYENLDNPEEKWRRVFHLPYERLHSRHGRFVFKSMADLKTEATNRGFALE